MRYQGLRGLHSPRIQSKTPYNYNLDPRSADRNLQIQNISDISIIPGPPAQFMPQRNELTMDNARLVRLISFTP